MRLRVLTDDAFHSALLHHEVTDPLDLTDLWPAPHEAGPAAAA